MRALLAVVLLAVAAACGGQDRLSKEEYEVRVQELLVGPGSEATRLYTSLVVDVRSQDECADAARRFHAQLEDILDQVDDLRPPEEVEALQREFLSAARDSVDRVRELVDEIERGRLSCGQPFNDRAYGLASTERAVRALDGLGERGYRLGRE